MARRAAPISSDKERLRQLAAECDCFTEDDHLTLTGYTSGTAESKRRRGESPPYLLNGNVRLYPKAQYREWLTAKVRARRGDDGRALL